MRIRHTATAFACALALVAAGCGGDEEEEGDAGRQATEATTSTGAATTATTEPSPSGGGVPSGDQMQACLEKDKGDVRSVKVEVPELGSALEGTDTPASATYTKESARVTFYDSVLFLFFYPSAAKAGTALAEIEKEPEAKKTDVGQAGPVVYQLTFSELGKPERALVDRCLTEGGGQPLPA